MQNAKNKFYLDKKVCCVYNANVKGNICKSAEKHPKSVWKAVFTGFPISFSEGVRLQEKNNKRRELL